MGRARIMMAELTLSEPPPGRITAIADLALNIVMEDVVKGKANYLILLTFKGCKVKFWQLHDCPAPDDVVRTISQREKSDAIAFVFRTPLPPEIEQGDRGYNIAVEAPSGKADALIALWEGDGSEGEMMRIYGREVTNIGHKWFGVDPEMEVDIWVEGLVGMVGETAEA